MRQFDESKLSRLHTADELLDSKYGAEGTKSRADFEAKARAYYYGVVLRDRRKQLNMTQQELAEKTGTARSYVARVERGETDIQLSSLLRLADALKMSFAPVFA